MEKNLAASLEKACPSFYRIGQKIGEERLRKLPEITLYLWLIWPLFVMLGFALVQKTMDPSYYGYAEIMYGWHQPVWAKSYAVIGGITLAVGAGCIIAKLIKHGGNSLKVLRDNIWFALLLLLLLWAFVSMILSGQFTSEWRGEMYKLDGYKSCLIYACVFVCAGSIYNRKSIARIITTFTMTVNLSALLIVLQYLEIQAVLNIYPDACASVFYNTNHCGYYLTMSIICLFSLFLYESESGRRLLYVASMILQYFALLKNNTFGCILAVWLAIPFVYVVLRRTGRTVGKSRWIPLLGILITTIIFNQTIVENFAVLFGDLGNIVALDEEMMDAGSGRGELWINAVQRIAKRPIFGYGPEGFFYCFPNCGLLDRPHCEILQYAAFYGIPGLAMYLGALIALLIRRWKEIAQLDSNILIAAGVVFAYLVSSCFGLTTFYTSPYFFMFLGFVAFADNSKKALQ